MIPWSRKARSPSTVPGMSSGCGRRERTRLRGLPNVRGRFAETTFRPATPGRRSASGSSARIPPILSFTGTREPEMSRQTLGTRIPLEVALGLAETVSVPAVVDDVEFAPAPRTGVPTPPLVCTEVRKTLFFLLGNPCQKRDLGLDRLHHPGALVFQHDRRTVGQDGARDLHDRGGGVRGRIDRQRALPESTELLEDVRLSLAEQDGEHVVLETSEFVDLVDGPVPDHDVGDPAPRGESVVHGPSSFRQLCRSRSRPPQAVTLNKVRTAFVHTTDLRILRGEV